MNHKEETKDDAPSFLLFAPLFEIFRQWSYNGFMLALTIKE